MLNEIPCLRALIGKNGGNGHLSYFVLNNPPKNIADVLPKIPFIVRHRY
jgi:hypothetical protein